MTPFHDLERTLTTHLAPASLVQRLMGRERVEYDQEIRPGVSEGAVADFEKENRVSLPKDLRSSYQHMDGTTGYTSSDHGWVRFWPLAEWSPVSKELPEHVVLRDAAYSAFYAFADHGIWAWCYAISLTGENAVYECGASADHPRRVASSFAEFVSLVVQDSDAIF